MNGAARDDEEHTTAGAARSGAARAVLGRIGLDALVALECATADADTISGALGMVTRVRRLVDAIELECVLRLEQLADTDPSVDPDAIVGAATGRSAAAAARTSRRARRAAELTLVREALARGEISVEHLDAFVHALANLPAALRPHLVARQHELVDQARAATAEAFREQLDAVARDIEGDDGRSRHQRQRRAVGCRTWTGRDGMWNVHGRFDAERAVALIEALRQRTETVYHRGIPADAPDDPLARHEHLRGIALAELMLGGGSAASDPLFIVTIDEQTLRSGRHEGTRVRCGHGIHVPLETLLQLAAGRARFVPVVTNAAGVVIAQGRPVPSIDQLRDSLRDPVPLDHGRSRRQPSRAQLWALRAMHPTCVVGECRRDFADCEIHHIHHWEHGGTTDLHNLVPLCRSDHHRLHAEGWYLGLDGDRRVTMSTGPPASRAA